MDQDNLHQLRGGARRYTDAFKLHVILDYLSSGLSKEAIMRIHERAGHPTTEVYELTTEV